jgi:hypothetical protein
MAYRERTDLDRSSTVIAGSTPARISTFLIKDRNIQSAKEKYKKTCLNLMLGARDSEVG